jgi:hypothetical protein
MRSALRLNQISGFYHLRSFFVTLSPLGVQFAVNNIEGFPNLVVMVPCLRRVRCLVVVVNFIIVE